MAEVTVSIRRASTGTYWDGSTFAATGETWLGTTGTTSWSYLFDGAAFPADGGYTVRFRSVDAVGNTATSSVSLVIDTAAPPTPVIVQAPTDPGGASAQFDFTEAESGASTQCRLDSGAWTGCTAPVSYTALTTGAHTYSVRAGDVAGNLSPSASYTWTVDTGLPSIAFGFPASGRSYNNTTFAAGCGTPAGDVCGTASDPQGGLAAVAVSLRSAGTSLYWNGATFASAGEVFLPATGTTSWSYAIAATSFPAEGNYTFRARATDTIGLTSFDSLTITFDRTAPAAPAITSGPTGVTAGGDTFSFTGEVGAGFECRLDAGTLAACTSPKTYGALSDGSHTFDVRATDAAGNTGASTSRTWTVDATAPAIGTTFPTSGGRYTNTSYNAGCGTSTTGDICGTATDATSGVATVEISVQRASTGLYLTGTTFSAASQTWGTATGTTSWSYAIAATTFPADGSYTVFVRAADTVGNAATTSTPFVIDRTKPTAVGITTTNISTQRKLEPGDTYTLTYSEAVSPGSIIAGWNGLTTQNVVVRVTNGSTADKLVVYNSGNTATLPLGSVNLKRTDFVATSGVTFGKTGTPCTLTMSGSSVTITLGTVGGSPTVAAAAANMTWTPNSLVTDLAGNTASNTAYTEVDNDSDF